MENIRIIIKPLTLAVSLSVAGQVLAVGNGNIVSGSGNITQNANNTVIQQHSDKMIIQWDNMNVAKNESLNFKQNSVNSAVLNKIGSLDPTLIQGALNANGKVFIVNPNGVLIGNGAKINVGSLIASSLEIGNDDFIKGNNRFHGGGKGKVSNDGEIVSGQSTALIGAAEVANSGRITAEHGDIHLASGGDITLSFPALGKMRVRINQGSLQALINHGGLAVSRDGNVMLTAWATDKLTRGVINSTGVLEANDMRFVGDGSVLLSSQGQGLVNAGGHMTTRGLGSVEVSGEAINVADGAVFNGPGNTTLTTTKANSYVQTGNATFGSGATTILADNVLTGPHGHDARFSGEVTVVSRSTNHDVALAASDVSGPQGIRAGQNVLSSGLVDAVAHSQQRLVVRSNDGNINVNRAGQSYGDLVLDSRGGTIQVNQAMQAKSLVLSAQQVKQAAGAHIRGQDDVTVSTRGDYQQTADIRAGGDVRINSGGKLSQQAGVTTQAAKNVYYSSRQAELQGHTQAQTVALDVRDTTTQGRTASLQAGDLQLTGGAYDLSQGRNAADRIRVTADTLNLTTTGDTELQSRSRVKNDLTLTSGGDLTLHDLSVQGDTQIRAQKEVRLNGMLNGQQAVDIRAQDIRQSPQSANAGGGIRANKAITLSADRQIDVTTLSSSAEVALRAGQDVKAGIAARSATVNAGGNVLLNGATLRDDMQVVAGKDMVFNGALTAGRDVTIAASNIRDRTVSWSGAPTVSSGRHTTLSANNTLQVNAVRAGTFSHNSPDPQRSRLVMNGKTIAVDRYAAAYEVEQNGRVIARSPEATGVSNSAAGVPSDPAQPPRPGEDTPPTKPTPPATPGFPFEHEPVGQKAFLEFLTVPAQRQWFNSEAGQRWYYAAERRGQFRSRV
ncbi:filamentous hemagglutinin N-terminal domain-containing protein [Pantoea sp. 1.19]|uniref:two-partner secretion domain-containing protein n=1 Tax=Pantoea sp. 1.19 TaxID=1925589 RepID=UPI0009490AA2|nr:filamentous hemagglutinin N-terminal domain-containing protein [Pantoea sp. 1.19]